MRTRHHVSLEAIFAPEDLAQCPVVLARHDVLICLVPACTERRNRCTEISCSVRSSTCELSWVRLCLCSLQEIMGRRTW